MDPSSDRSALEVYKSFDGYKGGLNQGCPWSFTYYVTGVPAGVEVKKAELAVAENDTYQNALVYKLESDVSSVDIYNLKTDTQYFYKLNLTLTGDITVGTTGSLQTEASPRILNIDGTVNVRDIGAGKQKTAV